MTSVPKAGPQSKNQSVLEGREAGITVLEGREAGITVLEGREAGIIVLDGLRRQGSQYSRVGR